MTKNHTMIACLFRFCPYSSHPTLPSGLSRPRNMPPDVSDQSSNMNELYKLSIICQYFALILPTRGDDTLTLKQGDGFFFGTNHCPNQTLTCSPRVTRPRTTAVSAIQHDSGMTGCIAASIMITLQAVGSRTHAHLP